MSLFRTAALLSVLATAGLAQTPEQSMSRIGDDAFIAGASVSHASPGLDDVFAAGESVTLSAAITGSAYLVGRRVNASAAVAGDLFGAGMYLRLTGATQGDVSVAGYEVQVTGAVGGDLRAAGSHVSLAAPVAGYASLAAETVSIDGVIAGEAHISADDVSFGPAARIEGQVTLYEEIAGQITIPDRVAPAARITRIVVTATGAEAIPEADRPPSRRRLVGAYFKGVAIVAVLAALSAALFPAGIAGLCRQISAGPFRALWWGFLAVSALAGAGIVAGLTLIGLVVTPAVLLAAFLATVLGYVIGVFALGAWLLRAVGRDPVSLVLRIAAAGLGAVLAGLIALIPFLGWLFSLALCLTGFGALVLWVLRPAFYKRDLA